MTAIGNLSISLITEINFSLEGKDNTALLLKCLSLEIIIRYNFDAFYHFLPVLVAI